MTLIERVTILSNTLELVAGDWMVGWWWIDKLWRQSLGIYTESCTEVQLYNTYIIVYIGPD